MIAAGRGTSVRRAGQNTHGSCGPPGDQGVHHGVEFASGVAPQGGVDPFDDQGEAVGEFGDRADGGVGVGGREVTGAGVDDEDVGGSGVPRHLCEIADGDGMQAEAGEERAGGVAAREVVGDHEYLGHVASLPVRCRTTST